MPANEAIFRQIMPASAKNNEFQEVVQVYNDAKVSFYLMCMRDTQNQRFVRGLAMSNSGEPSSVLVRSPVCVCLVFRMFYAN